MPTYSSIYYLVKTRPDDLVIRCRYDVQNFDGTRAYPVKIMRMGSHNIAKTRIDVWFHVDGIVMHGVCYGDSQALHCRPTKHRIDHGSARGSYCDYRLV